MKQAFYLLLITCFPVASPAQPVKEKKLSSRSFIRSYGNLNNSFHRISVEKKINIAFLGGSITNMKGWRGELMQWLEETYPRVNFNFINAGIPSLGSLPHAFRLQKDVLDKGRIDLMFIESAVNDRGNKTTEKEQRRAIEGIIRHARLANPYMDMVVMAFVDEFKIADYNQGKKPLEVRVHEDLAKYYHLPFINLAEEVSSRIANNEFTWKDDFKNLHPSAFGQLIYFNTIKTLLQEQFQKPSKEMIATSLPVPLDEFNYSGGNYLSVSIARNKKGFSVDPSWKPFDSIRTRPGFVAVPMLVADKPGASFDLDFLGTAAGIAVVAGPDAGELRYSVDGKAEMTLDQYNKDSRNLYLPEYFLLADGLEKRKHRIHLSIAAIHNVDSKGNALRIVHFLVNN